jgi:hypothetical protein
MTGGTGTAAAQAYRESIKKATLESIAFLFVGHYG